jgi:para-aminobenzoate synthetase/4-amino-4-deoxychorismate lyase
MQWDAGVSEDEYNAAIRRIKEHLLGGDTYQVNYTFRMRSMYAGDPWACFIRLANDQRARYACFIDTGSSRCARPPQSCSFRSEVTAYLIPHEGHGRRGLMLEDDREQALWLHTSEKNRAENLMIVDMTRSDMGRVALCGSVHVPSLFSLEKYPILWQMTSTVTAQTTKHRQLSERPLSCSLHHRGAQDPDHAYHL